MMEGKMTPSKIGKTLWKRASHISSISLEKTISSLHFLCCSVFKSCLTLCHPMDCSTSGFPVLQCLPEFAKFMSIELVMPSIHLILCRPFSSCPQSFPVSGSFLMSRLFVSGGQSIGVSASASVLPENIQC